MLVRLTSFALITFATLGIARADELATPDGPTVVDRVVAPAAPAAQSLSLPRGKIALALALQSDLTREAMGDAISLAPDLAYGVTDRITVALVHTTEGATGFWSGLGTGSLCISGDRCADVYSGGALLSKVSLKTGPLAIAALGGVVYHVDPFRLGLGAGAEAMWHAGKIGIHVKPTIYIGLNQRDGEMTASGAVIGPNKEFVNAPLSLVVAATPAMKLGVQTGVAGPVEGFGDGYRVPVAVMAGYAFGAGMNAGVAFSLDRVAGGSPGGAMDSRSLTLSVGWVR